MKNRIYLSPPHMGGKELEFVHQAFQTNWIAPLGPNVDNFEKELAEYLKVNSVAAVVSGTAALHLALIILGIKPGDKILVSDFTFSASVNPIVYMGATPIFIDSEPATWNMSPVLLEKAIKDLMKKGEKPKAIITVHLYGMPVDMKSILEISKKYDIPLIEDAAEALGSKYDGKYCGTFGQMGILSFNGNKIITTSGGGALISDNSSFASEARFLATQAREPAPFYLHKKIGYNYRMSNIVAGIGRGQLTVLDERITTKRKIFSFYKKLLANIDGIEFLEEPNEKYFSNYWLTTILIDKEKCGFSNEDLRLAFENENIESRLLWNPMHRQPVFEKYPAFLNGVSEKLFEKGLCLPSGTSMTNEDFERIEKVLKNFLK